MTTDTIQGNKLIAQFMGVWCKEYKINHYESSFRMAHASGHYIEDASAYTAPEFALEAFFQSAKYDSDWSWLMPVVQKIESVEMEFFGEKVRFPVTIATDKVEIGYSYYSHFEEVTEECPKIVAAYTVIVDFIQWYNEQKDNQ